MPSTPALCFDRTVDWRRRTCLMWSARSTLLQIGRFQLEGPDVGDDEAVGYLTTIVAHLWICCPMNFAAT